MNRADLLRLQFDQERSYARRLRAAAKSSAERAQIVRDGYDAIATIFAAANGSSRMGVADRSVGFVQRLLARQQASGLRPRLFEIGYGAGELLSAVAAAGFDMGGIEVSTRLHAEAVSRIAPVHHAHLRVGSLLDSDLTPSPQPTLVYWNDVFEHVPPDEIADYLTKIYGLLAPGGLLVTITPNWHIRPGDITSLFHPPRTEAQGLHLKEYTLREVTELLAQAGFSHVRTPLCVTRARVLLVGDGLLSAKCKLEPVLERLPFRLASLLVRGFGLSCSIAQKAAC